MNSISIIGKCIFIALFIGFSALLLNGSDISPEAPSAGASQEEEKYDFTAVPGVVLAHSPSHTKVFLGSPSFCISPDGTYFASYDIFKDEGAGSTVVMGSKDKGKTWQKLYFFKNLRWASLTWHKDALYILGSTHGNGDFVIMKSQNEGRSWTEPSSADTGIIIKNADKIKYAAASVPSPFVLFDGKVWHSINGKLMYADENANLLKAGSWKFTENARFDERFKSLVTQPWSELTAILDVDKQKMCLFGKCPSFTDSVGTIVRFNSDGKPENLNEPFARLPGGSKKTSARYDPVSKKYYALTNYIPEEYFYTATYWQSMLPSINAVGVVRNTLALVESKNLVEWKVKYIPLKHPNTDKVGFQYAEFEIDGDDLVFLSRTAYFDGVAEADNSHNSNFITFHRIKNFRNKSLRNKPLNFPIR